MSFLIEMSKLAWSKWRPAGHIRPETTCNQARQIIYLLLQARSLYYKGLKKIFILISSAALRTSATHAADFNPLRPSGNYMNHLLLRVSNAAFCIYWFCMVLTVNSDHFLKQH
jgi:hypothetical protein